MALPVLTIIIFYSHLKRRPPTQTLDDYLTRHSA